VVTKEHDYKIKTKKEQASKQTNKQTVFDVLKLKIKGCPELFKHFYVVLLFLLLFCFDWIQKQPMCTKQV